jgi:two-component sensor histidine kinase
MVRFVIGCWHRIWHDGLPPHSISAFAFALLCVVFATLVRSMLGALSADSAVFAPYYSATLVAALVGGAQAGGFAACLGALAAFWFFVPADWASHAFDREQLVSYFLFAVSTLVIIWAAKGYRDLLGRLRDEEDRRQLLNGELAHRIKNTSAIVQSLINQSLRDQPVARAKLSSRIAALAATNDLLIKSEWRGASIREILTGEIAPYDPARFQLRGEDFECPSATATVLALIFHELTSNAAKYGALSAPRGRVMLFWTRHDRRADFDWVETGGPRPAEPQREGFGTTLLRRGLRPFEGAVEMRFAPTGLHCRLSLTLPAMPQEQMTDLGVGSFSWPAFTSAFALRPKPSRRTLVIHPPRVLGQK